jgi:hypothetical protein
VDELFRFVVIRPPQPALPIAAAPSPALQAVLDASTRAPDRRQALKNRLAAYRDDDKHARVVDLRSFDELRELAREFENERPRRADDATASVVRATGKQPAEFAKDADLGEARARLADELVIAHLLSSDGTPPAHELQSMLRAVVLVERLVERTLEDADLARVARAAIAVAARLPAHPAAAPPTVPTATTDGADQARDEKRVVVLRDLLRKLDAVGPSDLAPPAAVPTIDDVTAPPSRPPRRSDAARGARAGVTEAAADLPAARARRRSLLAAGVVGRFTTAERTELDKLALPVDVTPLPELLDRLTNELVATTCRLGHGRPPQKSVALIGGIVQAQPNGAAQPAPVPTPAPSVPSVPSSVGTAKPVGVGELLVVRQQLVRYEPGEIAHIENVLASEQRVREHKQTRAVEVFTDVETEQSKEAQRDTQSVERFELQREVSTVLREDARLEAGASVEGSYGPTIEFSVEASGEVSRSREEAARNASNYSKEVTDRATTRLVERKRERRSVRTVDTTVERNKHAFDNREGTANISGTYQFLDKVVEAQVFSYGRRMLFDVTVPEPAALLLQRLRAPAPNTTVDEPPAFDVDVCDIDVHTYLPLVERYRATGVRPPPKPYVTVAKTFEGAATEDEYGTRRVVDVTLPDGYAAMSATLGVSAVHLPDWDESYHVIVLAGDKTWWYGKTTAADQLDRTGELRLEGEVGSLALAIRTGAVKQWVLGVEIGCKRTAELMDAWRLETFAALEEGHLRQRDEFERAITELEVDASQQFGRANPAENRRRERDELKRLAISTLTAQQFELFGAVGVGGDGLPAVDLVEADAEGRYVRFFEQAFEWERMSFRLFPYFWGRRSTWLDRLALDDSDPDFAQFLRAGAARVIVSVRPGFESAVVHYLDTGEIWDGAQPPGVASLDYVALLEETVSASRPGSDEPFGEPWQTKLPTSLIRLRDDAALPEWRRDEAGTWVGV